MDNPKSPLMELFRKYYDDEYQPVRLYGLLDEAKDVLKRCFKHKGNNKYANLLLDGFDGECQWAKGWIREEHAKNPALSTEAKAAYLKDWVDYIERIYQWLQSAFRNGNADRFEYRRLQNLRDGLFEQGSIFYQAEITHLEERTKRLRAQYKRLRNELKASLDIAKQAEARYPQADSAADKAGQEPIEIEIDRFREGPSKRLIRDLASHADSKVEYDEKRHGKIQPRTLKERLKGNGYEHFMEFFHKDGKFITCDKKIVLIVKK